MKDHQHTSLATAQKAQRLAIESCEPTPPAMSSVDRSKAWVFSAAKRVGIVPSTPKSKMGGKVYKRISPRKSAVGKTIGNTIGKASNQVLMPSS